jgi:hypothetical protein
MIIEAVVQQKKPAQGEKGQYGYVRQAEEKPKRNRKKRTRNTELPDEEYAGASDAKSEVVPAIVGILGMQGMSDMMPGMSGVVGMYSSMGDPLHAHSGGPFDRPTINNTPAEEEMDDTEEGGEWAVRIGNDPPPQWAKRKPEETEEDSPIKRQRTMSADF